MKIRFSVTQGLTLVLLAACGTESTLDRSELAFSRFSGQEDCRSIPQAPTEDRRWKEGLGLDVDNEIVGENIVAYRVQWFSGGWSGWYTPGVADIDWKTTEDGKARRVWSYFYDHQHEYTICAGSTLYVDQGNGSGNEDGTRSHPFLTIQRAIQESDARIEQYGGVTISVARGVYREIGDIDIEDRVALIGENPDTTWVVAADPSQHAVIHLRGSAVVSGFTLKSELDAKAGAVFSGNTYGAVLSHTIIRDTYWGVITYGEANRIIYNTLVNNEIGLYILSANDTRIESNIIFGSNLGVARVDHSTIAFIYNDVAAVDTPFYGMDDQIGTNGNISVDPQFRDAANGDFHLRPGSPAIDAGNPCSAFDREPLPNGGRSNLGAYGNTPFATPSGF